MYTAPSAPDFLTRYDFHLSIARLLPETPTPEEAQKAKEAIARGRAIGAKTERERFYIEAIAEYWDRFGDRPHSAR